MVDYVGLKQKIIEDDNLLYKVLEKLNIDAIHDRGRYLAFANEDGDNQGSNVIYKDTLHYDNHTRAIHGDLITLVMTRKNCKFPQALDYVARWTGIKTTNIKIHKPFGGFYEHLISDEADNHGQNLPTYSEDILPCAESFSYKFVKDGISVDTQRSWGIRYSHEDDAILIPIRNIQGELIGVKARNNRSDCDFSARWYAWKSYSKNSVVYGLDKNYMNIVSKRTIVIAESEKSCLQADSFSFPYICAIGGHCFSQCQSEIIKSLMADRVIVAFDSDICEDEVRYEASKLIVTNQLMHNKVGYIYGGLDPAAKLSPTDCGREVFQGLIKNNVKWLEVENGTN